MKFIVFHGSFASSESNWFPELKEKLESLGQTVIVPQFPIDDWDRISGNQNLQSWLLTFEKEVLPKIKKGEKLCFIGHSLSPLFILHTVSKFSLRLDSAIFVSPFMDELERLSQINHVNKTFYKTDFDFEKLKKLIPVSYVLYSDNDPYVDKKYSIEFGKRLDSSLILVKGGKHMNSETGFTSFPLVYELCKTRLEAPTYQKDPIEELCGILKGKGKSVQQMKDEIRREEFYYERRKFKRFMKHNDTKKAK